MKLQIVGFTIGLLLIILGMAELIPALADLAHDHANARSFFISAFFSLFFGGALILANQEHDRNLSIRQAFFLTSVSWFLISAFAAIPLYMSDIGISFTDAFFEIASGITTTGSTVLSGLDEMSHGVLLWRSLTQWIGGIGIIGFAIVLLPFLRIGGMQLFRTESSDKSEKIMPRTTQIATSIVMVYLMLTTVFVVAYKFLGMSWFDAVNHAMTTIATGGYSTHDASFGHFNSYAIDMAGAVFMLLSSLPFILYVKLVYQGDFAFFRDEQVKSFFALIAALTAGMTFWVWDNTDYSLADSFRHTFFTLSSIISTTGYATTDYLKWGTFSVMFFLLCTYLGACAGSTAGGLKTMRLVIVIKATGQHLKKLIYPHGVFNLKYQGRILDNDVVMTVFGFLALYVGANVLFTLLLTATGMDFNTAISSVATSFANVGPGIGDIIGPSGNFAPLSDFAKWTLAACMIVGRLEIFTVIVLFSGYFWQK